MRKTLFALAAGSLLLASTPAFAQSYPPRNGEPVIDAAHVLPSQVEDRLDDKIQAFERNTGHQLVVATVPSLGGDSVEEYARDYYRYLRLDRRGDGILFLVAPREHKMRIEVGGGSLMTDAAAASILRSDVKPAFKAGDLPGGIESGTDSIIRDIGPGAPVDSVSHVTTTTMSATTVHRHHGPSVLLVVIGLLLMVGIAWAAYWFATAGDRERRRQAEERALAESNARAAAEREAQRQAAAAAQAQAQAQAAQAQAARTAMLANMTQDERDAFLAKEAAAVQAQAQAQREADLMRQRDQALSDRDRAIHQRNLAEDDAYYARTTPGVGVVLMPGMPGYIEPVVPVAPGVMVGMGGGYGYGGYGGTTVVNETVVNETVINDTYDDRGGASDSWQDDRDDDREEERYDSGGASDSWSSDDSSGGWDSGGGSDDSY